MMKPWIYNWISNKNKGNGKTTIIKKVIKKNGNTPTPQKLVVTNGVAFGYSSPNMVNFIKELDFSKLENMSSLFYYCDFLNVEFPLIDTSSATNMTNMFARTSNLITIPLLNTSNVTNMNLIFYNSTNFQTMPLLDTSNVTNMSSMFNGCSMLENVPLLNTSSVSGSSGFSGMFTNCYRLTDASLDNILQMCANATSYTGTKRLGTIGIGIGSSTYPRERFEALPHYQEFYDAGWRLT